MNAEVSQQHCPFELLLIGASAGGLGALKQIFRVLPAEFPIPAVVVQHCWPHSRSFLPEIIGYCSTLQIHHAKDGDLLFAGNVYIAPPGRHVVIRSRGVLNLTDSERVLYSRPSIDVLFASAADVYRERTLGVILSGANSDGTKGTEKIRLQGGVVIAQKPAAYPRMPEAAIDNGCVHHALPIESIAKAIIALCMLPGAESWTVARLQLAA